jgi:hypothetical protein
MVLSQRDAGFRPAGENGPYLLKTRRKIGKTFERQPRKSYGNQHADVAELVDARDLKTLVYHWKR